MLEIIETWDAILVALIGLGGMYVTYSLTKRHEVKKAREQRDYEDKQSKEEKLSQVCRRINRRVSIKDEATSISRIMINGGGWPEDFKYLWKNERMNQVDAEFSDLLTDIDMFFPEIASPLGTIKQCDDKIYTLSKEWNAKHKTHIGFETTKAIEERNATYLEEQKSVLEQFDSLKEKSLEAKVEIDGIVKNLLESE